MTGIDINSLTLGEVAKVEDLSGLSINAIAADDKPKGKALAALAFVAKKREDPKFTWNQALGLTLTEAQEILGIADDEPEEIVLEQVPDDAAEESYGDEAADEDPADPFESAGGDEQS